MSFGKICNGGESRQWNSSSSSMKNDARQMPRSSFGSNRSQQPSNTGDENAEQIEFEIESCHIGLIIGRAGSKIRELQEMSGAHINVDKQNTPPFVKISGDTECQKHAKRLISELISGAGTDDGVRGRPRGRADDANPDDITEFDVDARAAGRVIGKGGTNINKLRGEFPGIKIDVIRVPNENYSTVRLVGPQTSREQLKKTIEDFLDEVDRERSDGGFRPPENLDRATISNNSTFSSQQRFSSNTNHSNSNNPPIPQAEEMWGEGDSVPPQPQAPVPARQPHQSTTSSSSHGFGGGQQTTKFEPPTKFSTGGMYSDRISGNDLGRPPQGHVTGVGRGTLISSASPYKPPFSL